jgi:hypothetical protein
MIAAWGRFRAWAKGPALAAVKRHDWVADALLCAIPFWLAYLCVVAVFVYANDWLNPPPLRRWFSDRLCGPSVILIAGFIPYYRRFKHWDITNT